MSIQNPQMLVNPVDIEAEIADIKDEIIELGDEVETVKDELLIRYEREYIKDRPNSGKLADLREGIQQAKQAEEHLESAYSWTEEAMDMSQSGEDCLGHARAELLSAKENLQEAALS